VSFLASRRWVLFAVTVVLLAYGAYLLGQWQFSRLHEREATNAQTRANLRADPVPVEDVLAPGRGAARSDEWRRVTATGRYLAEDTVVIRYQTRDGASGVDIVTPLRTGDGPLLLVDRGWLQTDNVGADQVAAPAPPPGRVTVVGWVRTDATGGAAAVSDRSARAISSAEIARTLDDPVYGGFVDVQTEAPSAGTPLAHAEPPDLGNGPHFFYGLQWWFFGALAVFGFCYLAFDERRRMRAGRAAPGAADRERQPSSQRPEHAPVDGQHRAGDEARSR
jgi:cytochrome oxidase assembly protein ShyY1